MLDILCESSAWQTIHIKCQPYFLWKKKKKKINVLQFCLELSEHEKCIISKYEQRKPSESPYLPACPHGLICSLVSNDSKAESEGHDQNARMCRLITVFAVCIWYKGPISVLQPVDGRYIWIASVKHYLLWTNTNVLFFSSLWAITADDKFVMFLLIFPENKG